MPTTSLPLDLAAEQASLDRKRKLAETLLQSAGQQPQGSMVSGHFVAPSVLQQIAPLLQTLASRKINSDLDAGQTGITNRYNAALGSGVQDYLKTRDGSPAVPGYSLPADQAGPVTPDVAAVKGDPRKAAVQALVSGLGPLQALGQSDLSTIGKSTLTPKDLLGAKNMDPKSVIAAVMANDPSLLQPERKVMTVNGQVVEVPNGAAPKAVGDFRDKFGPVGPVGTGAGEGQVNSSTGEVKFAPRGVNVSVDTGDKGDVKFAQALGESKAKMLVDSKTRATSAAGALDAIGQAEDSLSAGIKSGAPAEVNLALSKVGKALGFNIDDSQIANTEVFRSTMARETLNLVKQLGSGTGISNADRDFAEKAAGGAITLDNASMLRLIDIAKASSANVLLGHNRLLNAQKGNRAWDQSAFDTFNVPFNFDGRGRVDYDPKYQKFTIAGPSPTGVPSGVGSSKGVPMSLDQYLKGK